jgi:FlaA1/EpsC-like NDP-sugar epimerase
VVRRPACIEWHRFLARLPLPQPSLQIQDALSRQSILVTGAGGSIGSALSVRLAGIRPRALVLLEASDNRLSGLKKTLASSNVGFALAFVLGELGNADLLEKLFAVHAPTLVFHAAASKHVPLLEKQPFTAVKNNVFGTELLVSVASAHHAHVLLLSTDKAVAPTSIMGATKRIAEHIVRSSAGTALRLGNVLASSESVVQVFLQQLANHKPLTVTDPAARRYFLTIDEAVSLLLTASQAEGSSRLFVPALSRQHFVVDLARFLARELTPERKTAIEFCRLRPGEKECETLWSSSESTGPADERGLIPVRSPQIDSSSLHRELAALRSSLDARDLPALLARLKQMVPDYTPSETMVRLAARPAARVAS